MRARLFAIDSRSLWLFRVALGAIVFFDLIARAGSLSDHYSDWGVLPRAALAEEPLAAYRICIHAWGGTTAFEAALFAAACGLSVAFVLGRGGVAVVAILWCLTVSLQNRNFMVLNKGDQIFRLLLFWSLFLPMRARGPVLSMGSAGLLLQASLVWLVSAMLKTGREWFPDGTATYYALQMDHGTTAFGHWLGQSFAVTKVLTYAVYFIEWCAPLLLFWPVRTALVRVIVLPAIVVMQIGFGMSLRLGFFPAISICALIPFVPSEPWDRLGVPAAGPDLQGLSRPWNGTAATALLLVLWLNAAAVIPSRVVLPALAIRVANTLRLDQTWAMFAPYPDQSGGWYVAGGHLPNGEMVDAYHLSPSAPRLDKPERRSAAFPSSRWLYYMTNLAKPENAGERPWFAAYLCRRFDSAHVSALPLRDVEVLFFRQRTLPDYRKTPGVEETLAQRECGQPSM